MFAKIIDRPDNNFDVVPDMYPIAFEDLIMVKAPYNILYDIEAISRDSVGAKVKNEYLYNGEGGPISAAEAGRHMAILGSMALSASDPLQKCFFLAINAKIERAEGVSWDELYLKLRVKVDHRKRRSGQVSGFIEGASGRLVYKAVIKYQILSDDMFLRFFGEKRRTDFHSESLSFDYGSRRTVEGLVVNETTASGYFNIKDQDCLGHFDEFPALPVAVLGNHFGSLGVELLKKNGVNVDKALVMQVDVNAKRLVFSGEKIEYRAEIIKKYNSSCFKVYCVALVNKEIVADNIYVIKSDKAEVDTSTFFRLES